MKNSRKRKKKKGVFFIILLISMAASYPKLMPEIIKQHSPSAAETMSFDENIDTASNGESDTANAASDTAERQALAANEPETLPDSMSEQASSESSDTESGADIENDPETSSGTESSDADEASASEASPESDSELFSTVDLSYFDDALFVGDSRTVGLWEYSNIDTADFFCDNGLNSFQTMEKELKVPGFGKITLPNLLASKKYAKIYIMLGINELGYPFNQVVKQYAKVVEEIRNIQPDAIIYVMANMHVTKKRSDKDQYFNNTRINELNSETAKLADNVNIFYLDVNPVFDDESGSLRADYSSDNTHVYGKYYIDWGNWLCTMAVVR